MSDLVKFQLSGVHTARRTASLLINVQLVNNVNTALQGLKNGFFVSVRTSATGKRTSAECEMDNGKRRGGDGRVRL